MRTYPAYKDSGIEWLGDVPQKWDIKRLKFVSQINPSKPSDILEDLQCVFIPMEAMNTDGTFDQSEQRPFSELKNGFTHFAKDDVIFAKITPCFENGKGALLSDLDSEIGFGSTEFHALRAVKGRTLSKFLYYLTISGGFRQVGEGFMQGVAGQKRITSDFVEDFIVGVPSIDEQKVIVGYLDQKNMQIGDLIAKKERMIELLKEERAAIINQAVTKGLDPKAVMKDSGVEWIGKIPLKWEMKKLKYVGDAIIGLTYSPDETSESGTLVLRSSNIQNGKIALDNNVYVDKLIQNRLIVREKDILICSRNGSRALIGKCILIDKNCEGHSFGAFMTIFRSKFNRFIYHVLNSTIFSFHIGSFLTATINQLTTGNLNGIVIPFPAVEEQIAIAEFLDQKIAQIDDQIGRAEKSIEFLKEFRTALISEVVTGKIDVRN